MNRRDLLFAGLAGSLVGLLGAAPPVLREDLARLSGAWAQAAAGRRPLLVLVVPEDRYVGMDRGERWAELILHGPPRAQALLGQVEVVISGPQALVAFAPGAEDPDAWAWVLPADGAAPVPVHVDLEPRRWGRWDPDADPLGESDARIAAMTEALADALGEVTGGVDHLPSSTRERLVTRAIETLRRPFPAAAAWGVWTGCGSQVEGEEPTMYLCGMGYVHERTRNFLYFYKGR